MRKTPSRKQRQGCWAVNPPNSHLSIASSEVVIHPRGDFRWASIPHKLPMQMSDWTLWWPRCSHHREHKNPVTWVMWKNQVAFMGKLCLFGFGFCLNFINHLAYTAYSREFLSFVAHRMVSPHPKDEPKREQEEIGYVGGRKWKQYSKLSEYIKQNWDFTCGSIVSMVINKRC